MATISPRRSSKSTDAHVGPVSKIHTILELDSESKPSILKKNIFCIGPGRQRHLIPFLCTIALTIVIGMRSEMLGIISSIQNNSSFDSKSNIYDSRIFKPSKHRKLPWNDSLLEDLIENAVFFANMVGSPIGGYLTVNHDPSLLLGCSVAMTCGLNLFLPLFATIGTNETMKIAMVIVMRVFQGLAEGCLIPAIFGVLRFWAPANERSSIICLSVIGVSLGPLIGLHLCVAIETKWGWGVVFYIYANLGLVWCIFWWRMVDERPSRSKVLSEQERVYLLSSIDSKVEKAGRNLPIPWKSMVRSKSIYAILFTYAADDWTFQITSVCMQSYYEHRYHSDIQNTIILLVYPFLARSIFVPAGKLSSLCHC